MGQCYMHLSAAEREEISRGIALGWSCRAIARQLQRNVSTISRELRRHAPNPHANWAAPAHRRALRRARCPRRPYKLRQPWLAHYVRTALFVGWSPQRGSNENTNGLLRQYLPRNINLATLSQRELNLIAERLNNRPRQTLDWMTTNEAWIAQLQSLNVALGT